MAKRCDQPTDALWVSLVGRQIAAHGQPPNLAAMRRRAANEESKLTHEQRVGNDSGLDLT